MNAITKFHSAANMSIACLGQYRTPVFRGTLKARDGEQRFGRLKLDVETVRDLGVNNVGLFVECCPSFERMVEHFRSLGGESTGTWVIVASSKQVKEELIRLVSHGVPLPQNVLIPTPEELPRLRNSIKSLAGILIFDYACHIHKCRGNSLSRFQSANDRPQKIVDFRMGFRVGEWSPPLLLFTNRKAISVNTAPMLSPYCIEAFRYIDGQTMRFGEVKMQVDAPQLAAV